MAQMNVVQDDGEVNFLLQQIDPNANSKMTFSEIVHLLSNHKVPKTED